MSLVPSQTQKINKQVKVYPVEYAEPMEELVAKQPSLDPSLVACFTEEDIRIIIRNTKKLSKWGLANQNTIIKINESE